MKRESCYLIAGVTASLLVMACAPAAPPVSPGATATRPAVTSTSAPSAQAELLRIVPEDSEVRYRIREQLANLPLPNEAVGTTRGVTGMVVITGNGTVNSERSRIEVDLKGLQTDRAGRDRYVQRETLSTERFPMATFVPTEIKGLSGAVPVSGETTLEMIGDLTIRDKTNRVTWTGSAKYGEKDVMLNASLTTTFADLALEKPSVAVVLSVEDKIVLEADLKFARSEAN